MKRRGFTLLETVIALSIAIVVMGAALTANRVVQRNSQLAEFKTQQEAILSDTIDLMTLTHNALRQASQPFSTAFDGLSTTINSPIRVAPYRIRQIDPLTSTDPVVIKWCTITDVTCTGGSNSIVSTAGPISGAYTMDTALDLTGAEVIAIHKGAPAAGLPQVYDFTYLPTTGKVTSTTLFANSAVQQADWDFYRRQVEITNRSTQYGGYEVTVSVWPMVGGVNLQGETVSRSVVFTDF